MLSIATVLQQQIWNKLYQNFAKFTQGKSTFIITQFQNIIKFILDQNSQSQIDYMIKNIFRLDVNSKSQIQFQQFANFLLKRHCGQIILRKFHRQGKISNAKNMKINLNEFVNLVNHSYSFLEIVTNHIILSELFKKQDINKDGYITYAEYFQFIQLYLCHTDKFQQVSKISQNQKQGQQINSRLRKYIWSLLRQLYNGYDYDKNKILDVSAFSKLIIQILDICAEKQINFVLFNLFKYQKIQISFQIFANYLITYIAQLGLSRFIAFQNFNTSKLNSKLFVLLFKQSFKCLSMFKINDKYLSLFFHQIDKDNDGWISFDQYNQWITKFLSMQKLYNDQYLILQDNQNYRVGLQYWEEDQKSKSRIHFTQFSYKFSNYNLSNKVRQQSYKILVSFDIKKKKSFSEQQVVQILINLLRADDNQIFYVLSNLFRYDKNNDGIIAYQQFNNFFVQQHCGEIAIQRLHLRNLYKRGAQLLMNSQQFRYTINVSLSYINMKAPDQQLNNLFDQIDTDHDGWISYVQYFLFFKFYFGSFRDDMSKKISTITSKAENLSSSERLAKFIRQTFWSALRSFDRDRDVVFNQEEMLIFLRDYLKQNDHQINYVLKLLFSTNINCKSGLQYEQCRSLILRIYFGDVIIKRLQNNKKLIRRVQELKFNLQDFILIINTGLSFLNTSINRGLLVQVFKQLDTNKDQQITFHQYTNFIQEYLGLSFGEASESDLSKSSITLSTIQEPQVQQLHDEIINQLRLIFQRYDKTKNGTLEQQQIKLLIKQILHETTKRELDYIFQNLFGFDSNKKRKIQFIQFAHFILKHSAELALRRFHYYQSVGKNTLTPKEFSIVTENAYIFFNFLPKHEILLSKIFETIDKDHDSLISYKQFATWTNTSFGARIK